MARFFVKEPLAVGTEYVLSDTNAAHAKVLRLRQDDAVTLCTGDGMEYSGTISDISGGSFTVRIDSADSSRSEARVEVTVLMAVSKSDKFEHVIQKATELGASVIAAFPSERSVAKLNHDNAAKKLVRYQKIALAAAEQSGRGRIPEIMILNSYAEAVALAAEKDIGILFYENERNYRLSDALSSPFSSVAMISGPEGGLTTDEVKYAEYHGLSVCTLGNRILRCETAPLCALSAVMYAAGEF